ncbi:unnamed protein product [Pleuronectes platessa]|uniref:Uncharacterized protein n=1 Tax=Pleuronectes platessa TaxID=8262 RepID=A0A9N7UXG5_PLEPL|nr:unnamed protein product [Pleuronectes platessa]
MEPGAFRGPRQEVLLLLACRRVFLWRPKQMSTHGGGGAVCKPERRWLKTAEKLLAVQSADHQGSALFFMRVLICLIANEMPCPGPPVQHLKEVSLVVSSVWGLGGCGRVFYQPSLSNLLFKSHMRFELLDDKFFGQTLRAVQSRVDVSGSPTRVGLWSVFFSHL